MKQRGFVMVCVALMSIGAWAAEPTGPGETGAGVPALPAPEVRDARPTEGDSDEQAVVERFRREVGYRESCRGVMRFGVCQPPRPDDLLFSGPDPILSAQEETALSIADRWQEGNAASVNVSGKNGVITFKYGVQQPSIVCAVLQVCDVALQQGEVITAINLGDTVRWTVEPAVAGTEEKAIQHVIIKPLDVGLETSLVVTTDRRIYHMRLRSHRTRYMPQVAFSYTDGIGLGKKPGRGPASPGRAATVRAAPVAAPAAPASRPAMTEAEYLSNVDFGYRIIGDAPWKPVRAYNDGRRTYIHMPGSAGMAAAEAPTLLVVGGDRPDRPVSYIVEGDSYVVDGVLDRAMLVAGTGPNQTSVTIEKGR